MDIDLEKSGDSVRLVVDGNIDTDGGHTLSVKIQEVMEIDDIMHIVCDLTTVKTITSSGIGKLMNFYKFMDSKGGTFEIKGISDNLYKQFMEIHLDRIFPISK
ncbi:MAG: STAS domain-containing protein [Spirochaetes bacterium]|nr:STAS domain-containing protein [Spirochaetota bacterium]